jgi:hypothetical protein
MDQGWAMFRGRRSLAEEEIADLFSDELSDIPSSTSSGSDRGEQTSMAPTSESDISSDKSAGSSIVGTATWGKIDKTPALGEFTGNPGVQQFPVDSTQESAVAELFFGDSFFDMLCQETNRYYLQHREQRRHGQVKKPICISEYNMFMKGVDRADQYLAYYSLPRKTVK